MTEAHPSRNRLCRRLRRSRHYRPHHLRPSDSALGSRVPQYSGAFLYSLSQAVAIEPHISARSLGLFTAVTFRAFLDEAKQLGIDLNDISDGDIVRLCPSQPTVTRAIKFGQQVDDLRNQQDSEGAVAVYVTTDAASSP
jgi:hypothetical protein